MFATPDGAWEIGTPGMRALRLANMAEGVETVFADVAELARGCKFRNCAPESEPGCAPCGSAGRKPDADEGEKG